VAASPRIKLRFIEKAEAQGSLFLAARFGLYSSGEYYEFLRKNFHGETLVYDAAFRATGWPGDFQSLLGLTAFFRRPTRQHIHSRCKTIKNAQRVFAISAARRRIRSTRRLQIIRRSSIQPGEGVAGIGRAESREGEIHRPMLENTVASDDGPRSAENGSVSERRSVRRGSRRIAAEAEIIESLQRCEGDAVKKAGITKRVAFQTFRHTYTTCSHRTART
jgi:hypothetical protein